METWLALEKALFELAVFHDMRRMDGGRKPAAMRIAAELSGRGVISDEVFSTLRALQRIRNRAVHEDATVNMDDADEYQHAAARVFNYLVTRQEAGGQSSAT